MPLAIDLFCGLGGWTDGLIAEGYEPIGFDIERHEYWVPEENEAATGLKGTKPVEKRGWTQGCAITLGMEGASSRERTKLLRYPAQLVIQDVLTLHGSQFREAALIVASPPCQRYSYMAMPWTGAKLQAKAIREDTTGTALADLNALFDACFRIQREACEAAGRHIPMVVENVRGAIPWVGRSRWNFGSFHLWGDVPALMPTTFKGFKSSGMNWSDKKKRGQDFTRIAGRQAMDGIKGIPHRTAGHWTNPAEHEGVKNGKDWFGSGDDCSAQRRAGSGTNARKAASAMIAKIPLPLSRHIAAVYHPNAICP